MKRQQFLQPRCTSQPPSPAFPLPTVLCSSKTKISWGDFSHHSCPTCERPWWFSLMSYTYPVYPGKIPLSGDPISSSPCLDAVWKLIFIIFRRLLVPWKEHCPGIFSALPFQRRAVSSLGSRGLRCRTDEKWKLPPERRWTTSRSPWWKSE